MGLRMCNSKLIYLLGMLLCKCIHCYKGNSYIHGTSTFCSPTKPVVGLFRWIAQKFYMNGFDRRLLQTADEIHCCVPVFTALWLLKCVDVMFLDCVMSITVAEWHSDIWKGGAKRQYWAWWSVDNDAASLASIWFTFIWFTPDTPAIHRRKW